MAVPFEVIPAVDLKGGQCVRLTQGQAEAQSVYGADPVAMARHWAGLGATRLHVVDLDGAFSGVPVHTELVVAMAGAIGIPVQVGGGIRTDAAVERLLDGGVARVIIGTKALAEPGWVASLTRRYGERIVVGIDARDGRVQVRGWVETTESRAVELGRRMVDLGVGTIIYTDTARDGMLQGPNLEAMKTFADAVGCGVIASGGIKEAADVGALRRLGCPNLAGVIVGKALYEGCVELEALLLAAREG